MKKIFFVGANKLLLPFIDGSTTYYDTTVQCTEHFDELDRQVEQRLCRMIDFGMSWIFSKMHLQTSAPFFFSQLQRNLAQSNPDIIVSFDVYRLTLIQVLSYVKKNPQTHLWLFCETKKWPSNVFSRMFLRMILLVVKNNQKYIDGIIVYTEQGREWFRENLPEIPCRVCPVPVNTELFHPIEEKIYAPEGRLRLIINARYVDFKRHYDLFKALKNFNQEDIRATCTCIATGGNLEEKLREYVKKNVMQDYVEFIDPVPLSEMPHIYSNHDILVLPSKDEPIGWVVPEAMACGLPTITSDSVGANVYVEVGTTGYIFPTGDKDTLTSLLEDVWSDSEQLPLIGRQASERIHSQFSVSSCQKRFLDVIV